MIGGGPSLRAFDWSRLHGRNTVGCNDAYKLGESVCGVCVFGDLRWFNHHRRSLERFKNPILTNQPSLHKGRAYPWVWTMRRENRGLHKTSLGWGGNTGCLAINAALVLGAKRVFLLGFDMKRKDNKTNWHDDNIGRPNDPSYDRFMKGFSSVASSLPVAFPGCEVINLGPDSRLECFPKRNLDEVLV